MTEAVQQYVHELQQSVQKAALNFNVWWVYKSKDTRPKYVDVLNRYPHVVSFVHNPSSGLELLMRPIIVAGELTLVRFNH